MRRGCPRSSITCQVASDTSSTVRGAENKNREKKITVDFDITDGLKGGSNHFGDSVWCMHGCTHPYLPCCEIINVYAGKTGVTRVEAASFLGIIDMENGDSGAGRVDEIEIPNTRVNRRVAT